ncbi:2-succinyl-5-enolpyruvyl-6-hydroxy-3-cyclohexene-1-carboxylic-acid synthase [Gaopeijia maritima]|uniref:2-succinyl-5-enolpyruvyl-6-hydroxy-3- cyclohexene-1-carboxylic-acid synthase n=1 Tax=Gaopeijia maritima TaxID=3119007 RepID=UPI00324556AB
MNRNTVHARVLVDELVRVGVTDLCIAPGSRSTPLILAAAARGPQGDGALRIRVFIDERSAAFFALGLGKATGRPAAVVTTSGTAVANLLPAVVESAWSETPLLLLTADRPARLREADANQVIDQRGIFGSYPVLALELPPPEVSDEALRHVRATAGRAVAASMGLPAGPVHLNLPYAKPLEPVPVPTDLPEGYPEAAEPGLSGRPDGGPWTRVGARRPRASVDEIEALARDFEGTERGVIVAGPHPEAERLGPVLRRFASAWGVPLLADPLSGGRHGPSAGATVIAGYDLLLRDPEAAAALRPDRIVRVGSTPTSAALVAWLGRHGDVPQTVVDAGRRWKDHQAIAHRSVPVCPVDALDRLTARGLEASGVEWLARWTRADEAVADQALAGPAHEGHLARAVVDALPPGTPLFVSSSMPVRDVDAFGGARDAALSVLGNRGASGIDGIVSTALGVAAGSGRATAALVGDLAFLHDLNGLLATRERDARLVLVVVNNDGGGIFHMLPVREREPAFTPYFATPHGADFEKAAGVYGVDYRRVAPEELGGSVSEALTSDRRGTLVLEVRTDRDDNSAAHAASVQRAIAAARSAL